MVRLAIAFVLGILTGALVMVLVDSSESVPANERLEEHVTSLADQTEPQDTDPSYSQPKSISSTGQPSTNPDTPPMIESEPEQASTLASDPKLPEAYRRFLGPPVPRLTFAERFALFESESIDESWALPMEAGMSNYIAAHGPEAGTVFEYVQCRSNWCVLAGYILPGHADQTSQLVSPMRNEIWWQGGNWISSHGGKIGENEAFVIMMSRFNRQR